MKSIVLLVAASLMLVGAAITIAVPNTVQAAPNHVWCPEFLGTCDFTNKGECKKSLEGVAGDPKCVKRPLP